MTKILFFFTTTIGHQGGRIKKIPQDTFMLYHILFRPFFKELGIIHVLKDGKNMPVVGERYTLYMSLFVASSKATLRPFVVIMNMKEERGYPWWSLLSKDNSFIGLMLTRT